MTDSLARNLSLLIAGFDLCFFPCKFGTAEAFSFAKLHFLLGHILFGFMFFFWLVSVVRLCMSATVSVFPFVNILVTAIKVSASSFFCFVVRIAEARRGIAIRLLLDNCLLFFSRKCQ